MNYLLDTHALIWILLEPQRVPAAVLSMIESEQNELYVSAVSAWEIATKVRIGKLPEAEALEGNFLAVMETAGYTLLPLSVEDALRAGRLPAERRDPFDRMLAAQAIARDIPILSADRRLDVFGVTRIW